MSLATERLRLIIRTLQNEGSIRTLTLAAQLQVSEMTIRRDLDFLETQGHLHRVHGGAVVSLPGTHRHNERGKQALREKRMIARRAVRLLPRNSTIYLDSGTTAMEVAKALIELPSEERISLRIVTHASNTAAYLTDARSVRSVFQIGGNLDFLTLAATGPQAIKQIEQLHFDLFLMGVSGAHLTSGWTNVDLDEAEIKLAVMKKSRATYVIADSSKWQKVGFAPISSLTSVAGWVVDRAIEQELTRSLSNVPLTVIYAD
jgi:DeoR/GlpR family transcriptional regulator of sugar metabolism